MVAERAREVLLPIVYVNLMGAQDELVFDGGSMGVDASGNLCRRLPSFEDTTESVSLQWNDGKVHVAQQNLASPMADLGGVYQALVLGLRDYVTENGFKVVVLGRIGAMN